MDSDLKEKAWRELGENEEVKVEKLELLKEMIAEETTLQSRTDDNFLLRFLRARKFNTEKAFALLKNYYGYRSKHKDLYENLTVDTVMGLVTKRLLTVFPHRDSKGRLISVTRIGLCHPDEFPFPLGLQSSIVAAEKIIEDEITQINGMVLIIDLNGFSLKHLTEFAKPSIIYKCVSFTQDCFPVRVKEVHFVFNPSIFSKVYTIVSPLLKQKIRKRVHFHEHSLTSLHRYIPPDLLTEEYGGTLGPIDNQIWKVKLEEWRDTLSWHLNDFGYKTSNDS